MLLKDEINALYEKITNEESLNDLKVIKAYPYVLKPTKLESQVLTISPAIIDADSNSIGNDEFYGKCAIDLDLFSPYDFGSPVIGDAMQRIINCVVDNAVLGIKVVPIKSIKAARAFCAKCRLFFCYTYSVKEADDNEQS